jgi:ribosomal protein L11 methyltransferase
VIRLAVRVRREQAELVLAELLELAPAGVEESSIGEETVEYAIYGAPGELPRLPDLQAAAGEALVEISTSETADDWQERWRSFHRPVLITAPSPQSHSLAGTPNPVPALHVRPPWEAPGAECDVRAEEIVIDPGQAFGTGGHASTRLCLELLLELAALDPRRGSLLDVGTGSGVLAIAAARLGFAPVLGLDHERESVEAARANARVNGAQVEVRRFDLRRHALPWPHELARGSGTVVLANLLRPLLLDLAGSMAKAPLHLLAGGLLLDQVEEIVEAFCGRLGLRERGRRASGEWAAVWLSAP